MLDCFFVGEYSHRVFVEDAEMGKVAWGVACSRRAGSCNYFTFPFITVTSDLFKHTPIIRPFIACLNTHPDTQLISSISSTISSYHIPYVRDSIVPESPLQR